MADITYYVSDYIADNYHTYTADASADFTPYIDSQYIDSDFFENKGSVFTLTGSLTKIIYKLFVSDMTSSSTIGCIGSVLKSASVTLSSSFTQSTIGSRGKDIDLYAMSDAALSVVVARLRTTNVNVSSVFTVASEVSRIKSFASDETATFSLSGIVLRSRTASLDVQAAFSLTCNATLIPAAQDANASLESSTTLSVAVTRNRTVLVDLSLIVTQSTVVNRTRNALSDLTSAVSLTAAISNQKLLQAQLSSQATVSATISHIHGADLIAFSNAQLTASVSVVKSYQSDLQAQATQSTVVARRRIATAQLEAQTTTNAIGNKTVSSLANLNSQVTQSSSLNRIRFAIVDISSASAVSVTALKIISFVVGASSQFTVNATISHIHGADLTAFSNASLSTIPTVAFVTSASISSQASTSVLTSVAKNSTALLNVYSSIFASRLIAQERPKTFSGTGYSFVTSPKKYGSYSIFFPQANSAYTVTSSIHKNLLVKANEQFVFETWWQYTGVGTSGDTILAGVGGLSNRTFVNFNSNLNHWALGFDNNNGSTDSFLTFAFQSTSNTIVKVKDSTRRDNWATTGTWYHFAVTRGSDGIVRLYRDNTEVANYSFSGAFYSSATAQLKIFSWQRVTGGNVDLGIYYDSMVYKKNTNAIAGYDSEPGNDSNTIMLLPFENNLNDYTSQQQTGAAALTSTAVITATLGGPVRATATLSSSATINVIASKNSEIIFTAFSSSSVSANGYRIRYANSTQSSAVTQSITATVDKSTAVALTSQFAQTISGDRNRSVVGNFSALASELIVGDKTSTTAIALSSAFSQSTVVSRNQQFAATITSAFAPSILINITTNNTINMSAAFTQTTVNSRKRSTGSTQDIQADVTAAISVNKSVQSNQSSQFNFIATTSGLINYEANLTVITTQVVSANRLAKTSAALSSTFTQSTNTVDSLYKVASATLTSQSTATAIITRNQFGIISTSAVASELAVVVKIGRGIVIMDCVATVNAIVKVRRSAQAGLTSNTTVSATASRNKKFTVNTTSQFTVSAEGTTSILGEGQLQVIASMAIDADVISTARAALTSIVTLSCTPGRTRPFAALEVSAGTLTVTGRRNRSAIINTQAIASEMVIGDKLILATASLNSQFTMIANGRELDTGRFVYFVPRENREWTVQVENRTRKIASETRIYTIRRY